MTTILNSYLAKWFFNRYFNIPKDKEIFKLQRTSIHYWEDKGKGIAKCREYGQTLARINPFAGILAEPEKGTVNTAATNNKDNYLDKFNSTSNYGTVGYSIALKIPTDYVRRPLINFTLPAGSGTITAVKLYFYVTYVYAATGKSEEVHKLSGVGGAGWTETGSTWNKYDGTNDWAVAGGDFSATVVDASNNPTTASNWQSWNLGAGATNPIVGLTWGSIVNLMIKFPSETDETFQVDYTTKEASSNRPYIEITYTPLGPANLKTYNTNIKANIKTINTNAIANVKTLNTNA